MEIFGNEGHHFPWSGTEEVLSRVKQNGRGGTVVNQPGQLFQKALLKREVEKWDSVWKEL